MANTRFGLVVNARDGKWPSPEELGHLGVGWVRSIVYDFDEFEAALDAHPADVRVIALLNEETAGVGAAPTLPGWEGTVAEFAQRFAGRVHAVECLNEWDLRGIPPGTAARCADEAAPHLESAGIRCLLGSVAGPDWVRLLNEAARACDSPLVSGACFHPYGQRADGFPAGWGFGEIGQVVVTAREQAGMAIWVTEFGIKIGEAGGAEGQAEYLRRAHRVLAELPEAVLAVACYFCWCDSIGAPDETGDRAFGLRQEGPAGERRLAWHTCCELHAAPGG